MLILAIDTSCDETSVALTEGRKIIANSIFSQVLIHSPWGGVVPHLAKRAHEERIDWVIENALKKSKVSRMTGSRSAGKSLKSKVIEYIAVTYGPGLAPALEVGVNKARELAEKYDKRIIPVNHMEGHIYSCFAQNSKGNPHRDFDFPYIALLISGGHTQLVLFTSHLTYQIIGETVDDAAGESLDKAAKMLGLGYPGGAVIERLAQRGDPRYHQFPRPLSLSKDFNFSFSGLKTSLFYYLKTISEDEKNTHLADLASSFQEAVCDSLLVKLKNAIQRTGVNRILVGGGVGANIYLRKKIRSVVKNMRGHVFFPPFPYLYGDNAGMIGIAGYFKAQRGVFVEDRESFDRVPRLSF